MTGVIARLVCILAAFGGLGASLALIVRHLRISAWGALCADGGGCDLVLSSRWAAVAGVPVAGVGVVFWSLAAAAAIYSVGTSSTVSQTTLKALAWVGCVVSAVLVGLQVAVIRAVCPLCMTSAACALAMLGGAVAVRHQRPRPRQVAGIVAALVPLVAGGALLALWVAPVGEREILATMDGVAIRVSDWRKDEPDAAQEAELPAYEARRRYVERKFRSMALSGEAKRQRVARDELIAREVTAAVEAERAAIEAEVAGIESDPAKQKGLVEERLAEARERRLAPWLDALVARHQTQVLFNPPQGRRIDFDLKSADREGPADAPLQIVVFSDLQCPLCADLDGQLETLRAELGDQLAVYFQPFPLKGHDLAVEAAVLFEWLREKGLDVKGFRRMAFSYRGELTLERLRQAAVASGANDQEVAAALGNGALFARSIETAELIRRLKIVGAPTVLVNNRVWTGPITATALRASLSGRR